MFFAEVTFLRHQGARLRRGERDPPRRLMVTIIESDRDHNNSGRNTVEASLYEAYGTARMAGRGRITDPVIVPFKGPGILLAGTEFHTETVDGHLQTREHRQLWLCVPVERQGVE
ncbi:hypothetical protein [Variovorax paradoxus]|jgi:hypothetical protein|uniref:hypothetical protein n=1 Tax=Variovorax paradoxus TaxID=34073 RepID=UPI0029C658C0|nr:hypothetical protein [Variovorax paradoxus]WPH22335.1 hypothetical protein RZE78_09260 [Variovorax paradoxus]